jgi:predicted DNA-binding protein with PD1-like motif
MKYSEAKQGRIFVIRLEDGDIIHETIEQFAQEHSISCAYLTALGGIDRDSKLVCGPEDGRSETILPNLINIRNVHEVSGTGTIFPDEKGKPSLHMHLACGRYETTKTGCVRPGVKTWHILEVILVELVNCSAKRLPDKAIGFNLLEP